MDYDDTPPSTSNNSSNRRNVDGTEKQNVSASTPVKNDRSSDRIDMSNNNISPIHDYRPGTTARRVTTPGDRQQTPTAASPSSALDRSPAVPPYIRPASGRSAMDLYAAIHESKKRLLTQQPVAVIATREPTAAVTGTGTAIRRQPPVERQSDRYRPRDNRSARYDFKRLLLQTNMAGGRRTQQSAVVRLQQPAPAPTTPRSRVGPSAIRVGGPVATAVGRKGGPSPAWRSNVLSSTIQEDCREDEDYSGTGTSIPKSAALVNRTLKSFAAATCSTLETAL